jgi:sulfatase modifying factor 1
VISRVSPLDGMLQIHIPSGEFKMGANVSWEADNKPRHTVYLDVFWISQTQVTNAMYALCEAAGACTGPIRKEINPHYYDQEYASHPVVYILWDQAEVYCEWAGGRLPTEAQWEKAAGSGIQYIPWGGATARGRANVGNQFAGTVPVGSYPKVTTPFGVLDMGSNVREWVADWYSPGYYAISSAINPLGPETGTKKVLRGASWHDTAEFSIVTHRLAHVPNSPGDNRGFRCAFSD